MTFGLLSDTAMSSNRPPMLAGPIERNRNADRSGMDETLKSHSRCSAPRPCATPTVERTQRAARERASEERGRGWFRMVDILLVEGVILRSTTERRWEEHT